MTIAGIIDRHHERILGLWTQGAAQAAASHGMTAPELASTIPAYLSSLGRGTADVPVQLSGDQVELIERHLSDRLRRGFVLNEILTEFALLGSAVSRIVDEAATAQPRALDVGRLFEELYLASLAATNIFNEHMLEDEQTDKRYRLLLERVCTHAGGGPEHSIPLRLLLDELLGVIMAAMGAQTAALLLLEAGGDRLIMSASTGDADEHLEQYVSGLDASTFAGQLTSAGGEAVTLADAETTELAVSNTLRHSGIHSVLGIRLAAGHLLRGVLYVGVREHRRFTLSEIRRMEGLSSTVTMHLDNALLHAAQREQAEAASTEGELRERFVSVLMHDLMGPLSAAMANAATLLEPCTADDRERIAEKIIKDLGRAEWMVAGLVDVHRIRAGERLPLRLAECDLGFLALEAVDELRASRGASITVEMVPGVRGVWCAALLRRAIWNLVANGIEHGAPARPVTVTVTGDGSTVQVAVHNEGPQIPPADQARLFHPFSTPGSAVRGPRSGWGLGLTLVWGCAEAHGGRIEAESHPTAGTTFRLVLPADARPYGD